MGMTAAGRSDADREQIRSNLKEIYEREGLEWLVRGYSHGAGRALRDAKDSACQELERERQRTQESKQVWTLCTYSRVVSVLVGRRTIN